jgi:hypothetical protein
MRTLSKTGVVVGFVALALIIGAGLGLWVSYQGSGVSINIPGTASSVAAPATGSNGVARVEGAAPDKTNEAAGDANEAPSIAGWEQKLDDILISDTDEAAKAAQLLALMPTAPLEGQVQLAQHLVNLVQDDNYAMTGDLLTNPSTPREVSNVLLNDLLNRGNELKLPMLLAVARNDDHPLKSEAKDLLEIFIQDDKGANWNEWEAAVNQWLKDNQPPADPPPPQL